MAGKAAHLEQAITSFFKVDDNFTSSGDAANRDDMREKKMAYGILLHSCDLMRMTKDGIERKIAETKLELAEVRFRVKSSLDSFTLIRQQRCFIK